MQVAVSEAKGLLLDLVRKAEGGEEVTLTRHGHAIARIVGVAPGAAARRAALEEAARCRLGRRRADRGAQPGFSLRRSRPAGGLSPRARSFEVDLTVRVDHALGLCKNEQFYRSVGVNLKRYCSKKR